MDRKDVLTLIGCVILFCLVWWRLSLIPLQDFEKQKPITTTTPPPQIPKPYPRVKSYETRRHPIVTVTTYQASPDSPEVVCMSIGSGYSNNMRVAMDCPDINITRS